MVPKLVALGYGIMQNQNSLGHKVTNYPVILKMKLSNTSSNKNSDLKNIPY